MSKTDVSRIIRYRRAGIESLYNLCLVILRQASSRGFSYKQVESIIRTKRSSATIVQLVFENVLIRHLIMYSLQLNVSIDNIWRQLNYLLFQHSYAANRYDEYDGKYDPCTEFVTNCFQNAIQRHWHSKLNSSFVKTKASNVLDLTLLHIYEILSNESYGHFYQSQCCLLSSLSLPTFPSDWLSRLNHLHLSENLVTHYSSDQFLHQTIHNYLVPNAHDVLITGLSINVSRYNEKLQMINDILWESFVKNKASRLQLYRCDLNILYNLIRLFHSDYCLYPNDMHKSPNTVLTQLSDSFISPKTKPPLHDNQHQRVNLYKHSSNLVHCIEEIVIDTSHISDFRKHKESSRVYNDLFRFLFNMKKVTLKNCYIDNQSLQIYRTMAESFRLKYLSIENCIIQPQQTSHNDNHPLLFTPLTVFENILWYLTVLRLRNVRIYERVQNRIEPFFQSGFEKIFSISPSKSTSIEKKNSPFTYHLTTDQVAPLSFYFEVPLISILGPNAFNLMRHVQCQEKEIVPSKERLHEQLINEMTDNFQPITITKQNRQSFPIPLLSKTKSITKHEILLRNQPMNTKEIFVSNKQSPSSLVKATSKRRKINPLPLILHENTLSATLSSDGSVVSSTTTHISSSILSPEPVIHRAIYEHLRVLDLSGTQLETADYLRLVYIVEHAPLIEALDFSRWNKTVDFVPIFRGITIHCSNLKWLNLEQTNLTQSSITSLISLLKKRSNTMIYINLAQTNLSISPNYLLIEFVDSLHQCTLLEYLNLAKNSLSDQFLFSFLTEEYCDKVQYLYFFDIRQNPLITLDAIFQIVYRLSKHPIQTLFFCGLITTCNTNKEQRQVLTCHSNSLLGYL